MFSKFSHLLFMILWPRTSWRRKWVLCDNASIESEVVRFYMDFLGYALSNLDFVYKNIVEKGYLVSNSKSVALVIPVTRDEIDIVLKSINNSKAQALKDGILSSLKRCGILLKIRFITLLCTFFLS